MECAEFDTTNTTEFFDRLSQQRIPVNGSIELTFRCNLRCAHCYVGDLRKGDPQQNELSTAELKRIFDELYDAGCLWLLLTGGEPLMRPDWLEIYRYARFKGFVVNLFTNGTMLTPRIADDLAEYPPFLTEITLYGYSQATYERVTGIPGSYARCMKGIELLLERGLKLKLKTIAMSLNAHEIPDMEEFAKKLGVEFRYDALITAQLDGGKTPLNVRLSPEDIVTRDLEYSGRIQEYKDIQDKFGHRSLASNRLFTCKAGNNSFHIDPYGRLSPCMLARFQTFDLRHGSFEEGWNQFIPAVTSQPRLTTSGCEGCQLLAICGQCPGWSSLEHGEPAKRVNYLCDVAHKRSKSFGLNV